MKNAIVIAYINKTGELLDCQINCEAWGVKYNHMINEYQHYIEADGYINHYVPCNLLHINTPEALKRAEIQNIHWWQLYLKDIDHLKEALIKKGVIKE